MIQTKFSPEYNGSDSRFSASSFFIVDKLTQEETATVPRHCSHVRSAAQDARLLDDDISLAVYRSVQGSVHDVGHTDLLRRLVNVAAVCA